jgi:hypothetical protein
MRIGKSNALVHKPVSAGEGVSETVISPREGLCGWEAVDGIKTIVKSLSTFSSETLRTSSTKTKFNSNAI